jgi:hypothetical protein
MLFWSGWRSLSKTLTANWSKGTSFKHGTRYRMIDNMFEFQVIEVQVFSLKFMGVAGSNGTLLPFQAQNTPGGRFFRHSRGAVWDFGMVLVNKC